MMEEQTSQREQPAEALRDGEAMEVADETVLAEFHISPDRMPWFVKDAELRESHDNMPPVREALLADRQMRDWALDAEAKLRSPIDLEWYWDTVATAVLISWPVIRDKLAGGADGVEYFDAGMHFEDILWFVKDAELRRCGLIDLTVRQAMLGDPRTAHIVREVEGELKRREVQIGDLDTYWEAREEGLVGRWEEIKNKLISTTSNINSVLSSTPSAIPYEQQTTLDYLKHFLLELRIARAEIEGPETISPKLLVEQGTFERRYGAISSPLFKLKTFIRISNNRRMRNGKKPINYLDSYARWIGAFETLAPLFDFALETADSCVPQEGKRGS